MWQRIVQMIFRMNRVDKTSPVHADKGCPGALPLERWVEPPVWTRENEQAWREFLATPTGVALLHRGRAIAFNHSAHAIQGSDVRANGFAAGFFDAVTRWLPSLAISQESAAYQVDNDADPSGAEGDGE